MVKLETETDWSQPRVITEVAEVLQRPGFDAKMYSQSLHEEMKHISCFIKCGGKNVVQYINQLLMLI